MENNFNQMKNDVLNRKDRSFKGSMDKAIFSLCKKINQNKGRYTTSSCSGRVVIMVDQDKKENDLFLNIYHDLIKFDKIKKDIFEAKNHRNVKFKQEPCILHVACNNLKDALSLLNKANLSGWKKSGILNIGRRIVVELSSGERLDFPVIAEGTILVGDKFLRVVVKKANENLKKSWEKIGKLERMI